MDILSIYANSNDYVNLKSAVSAQDADQVQLLTQMSVNAFLSNVGELLHTTFIADTFFIHSAVFDVGTTKHFAVVAVMREGANAPTYHVFKFVYLAEHKIISVEDSA